MPGIKSYTKTLEFTAQLPGKPGDGSLANINSNSKRCLGGTLTKSGWRFGQPRIESTEQAGVYKLVLTLTRRSQRRVDAESVDRKAEEIAERLSSHLPGWKRFKRSSVDTSDEETKAVSVNELLRFPDNIEGYFEHIYQRDVQIREILDIVTLARDTNMDVRHHVLLYGPPGAGKTEIGLSLSRAFGELAVKRLDATSTTKAGAERLLLEADTIPPIIVLEEIEKVNEANLPWLLAVLDARGEIIKTTARMNVSRLAKSLLVATANNIDKLRTFHDGALIDRFSTQLYCPMPDRELLTKILTQEVPRIPGGKVSWVEPAIEYALRVEKTYQARRIKAIMAVGKDRLLDGSYQSEHTALLQREVKDDELKSEFNLR